jgi:D-sedoheptulose 7-phosphate isomerase
MDKHLQNVVRRYPALAACAATLPAALDLLVTAFENGGKLLLCGNGGSAADCDHIVGELMKSFLRPRPISAAHRDTLCRSGTEGQTLAGVLQGGLPCVALTGHTALNFAIANDMRADVIFAQQVYALGRPGDVLWGLSTSGNAGNVVTAFRVARVLGVRTLALTGQGGGVLGPLADVVVRVPATATPEVQELHLPIYHALCAALEEHFFGTKRARTSP